MLEATATIAASATDAAAPRSAAVLELRVRNHPGTLSHVAGLFARRAFNLDAVVCVPEPGAPEFSRMWLRLADEPRLDQVERQLAKLHDVLEIHHRTDVDPEFFRQLGRKD